MAVKIRMMRMGKTKVPYYRIVVIDERKSRNSQYLEHIGHFAPQEKDPAKVASLNTDKFFAWVKKGAQATDIVKKVFSQLGNKWPGAAAAPAKKDGAAKEKTGRKKKYHPIAKRVKKEKKARVARPPKQKKKAAKTA